MRASSPFGFSPLFQFAKANPRSTAPRTAALVTCAQVTPFFLRKKRAGGERRLWAATPHQSPFGRQLPLKGKPFGELRPGKSLPLEGKVLSVAKRMRCSAPQSALPSNPLVSPQRNGDPPRALLHKKSAGPDGCAVRAREARRKRERRPSGRACSHPWNPLSFSISLPKQVTPKTAFRMGFREGLWAPKPPP